MHDLPLITTIAAAFAAAWVLGIITQRLKLSPIVGYLLAGVAIGPHTPGFVGDVKLAGQLAEIGVMLLMFGVGLHFQLKDLMAVRKVAVPGAIAQSTVATLLAVLIALVLGWPIKSGLVLGIAMSVASTVVLLRVLMDNRLLDSPAGHVAVGWLIVEDIFTVVVLVLIPALAGASHAADGASRGIWLALLITLVKIAALIAILLLAGSKIIPWLMVRIARLRSHELFTLTVLVMAVTVAAGSQYFFGASAALGAFLAGMVVGQSPVSHQAAADVLPLRDAFAVLFFTSVGMLFDPAFVLHQPVLMIMGLAIVLIAKPVSALIIVALLGYPARTAIIVALGLAQIGEFSFILSEVARSHGLLHELGHNVLVACALVSITLNPILMRSAPRIERLLRTQPKLWRFLNRKVAQRQETLNPQVAARLEELDAPLAAILGYGPVGRAVDAMLRRGGMETVVIDLNMDTVQSLTKAGRAAIFGDAFNPEVLAHALSRATHLVISLPHSANRAPLIASAKLINPELKIFVRAHYIAEREELARVGADAVCYEETEAAVALARLVLLDQGADSDAIRRETTRIRQEFSLA
jgi:CPA2 family monovalent cation:H+ antiporter-2